MARNHYQQCITWNQGLSHKLIKRSNNFRQKFVDAGPNMTLSAVEAGTTPHPVYVIRNGVVKEFSSDSPWLGLQSGPLPPTSANQNNQGSHPLHAPAINSDPNVFFSSAPTSTAISTSIYNSYVSSTSLPHAANSYTTSQHHRYHSPQLLFPNGAQSPSHYGVEVYQNDEGISLNRGQLAQLSQQELPGGGGSSSSSSSSNCGNESSGNAFMRAGSPSYSTGYQAGQSGASLSRSSWLLAARSEYPDSNPFGSPQNRGCGTAGYGAAAPVGACGAGGGKSSYNSTGNPASSATSGVSNAAWSSYQPASWRQTNSRQDKENKLRQETLYKNQLAPNNVVRSVGTQRVLGELLTRINENAFIPPPACSNWPSLYRALDISRDTPWSSPHGSEQTKGDENEFPAEKKVTKSAKRRRRRKVRKEEFTIVAVVEELVERVASGQVDVAPRLRKAPKPRPSTLVTKVSAEGHVAKLFLFTGILLQHHIKNRSIGRKTGRNIHTLSIIFIN
ncbi:uncharacterized protein LOC111267727 isoform X2 [Varroa jacobsoni]|uniref:uncharacterized protein LOC111267727 isoform X2 n=1 Tax=Varroa jacobsoni TaxID=62625 RepID=UPI000BF4C4A1|nr:uncharacterized protein LOC111267727 isoform X2 [Varroa jacobsoni]